MTEPDVAGALASKPELRALAPRRRLSCPGIMRRVKLKLSAGAPFGRGQAGMSSRSARDR